MNISEEQHKIGDLVYHDNFETLGYISEVLAHEHYSVVWLIDATSHETTYGFHGIKNFKRALKRKLEE